MSEGQADGLATAARGADTAQQCILLACFAGAKRAGKIRRS